MKYLLILFTSIFAFNHCTPPKNFFETKAEILSINSKPLYFSIVPISYKLNYLDSSEIEIVGENVTINKEKMVFNINSIKGNSNTNISIYFKKTHELLYTFDLNGVNPPINVKLGNYKSGSVVNYDKFITSSLNACVENLDINLEFKILKYSFMTTLGDSIIEYHSVIPDCWYEDNYTKDCSFFSSELTNLFGKFKEEQLVVFYDIVIKLNSNEETELQSLIYIIKKYPPTERGITE